VRVCDEELCETVMISSSYITCIGIMSWVNAMYNRLPGVLEAFKLYHNVFFEL